MAADGRNGTPLFGKRHAEIFRAGLVGVVAAGSDEQDVGDSFHDILQAYAERWCAGTAENIFAASALDHLRYPVATDVEGLQPLEEGHAGALCGAGKQPFDLAEVSADAFYQRLGGIAAAGFFADPEDVAPDVAEVLGIEAKDLGALSGAGKGGGEGIGRSGADVAQILSDDEIGCEVFEGFSVHGVEALTA